MWNSLNFVTSLAKICVRKLLTIYKWLDNTLHRCNDLSNNSSFPPSGANWNTNNSTHAAVEHEYDGLLCPPRSSVAKLDWFKITARRISVYTPSARAYSIQGAAYGSVWSRTEAEPRNVLSWTLNLVTKLVSYLKHYGHSIKHDTDHSVRIWTMK